jgi:hypothetical protein
VGVSCGSSPRHQDRGKPPACLQDQKCFHEHDMRRPAGASVVGSNGAGRQAYFLLVIV